MSTYLSLYSFGTLRLALGAISAFLNYFFGTLGKCLSMSLNIATIVESSMGINSSVSISMKPMTSFLSMMTSYGVQLSIMILQLLFLSIETTAGVPETVRVLGTKMEAIYVMSLLTSPLYLAMITLDARARSVCSLMATI
jgi:hypothetical protein